MKISQAELLLLDALWSQSPLTAAEIAERVARPQGWTLQTVKTMLARLEAKGAVTHSVDGRRFLFRPLVGRDEVADRESERLLDRLFGGRAAPLLARLAERRKLSAEDIAEIRALLDRIEG